MDRRIEPAGIPPDLDPALRELFRRAFDDPFATDDRATATEWLDTLEAVARTSNGSAYRCDTLAVVDRYAEQFRIRAAATPTTPAPPVATAAPGYHNLDRHARPRRVLPSTLPAPTVVAAIVLIVLAAWR